METTSIEKLNRFWKFIFPMLWMVMIIFLSSYQTRKTTLPNKSSSIQTRESRNVKKGAIIAEKADSGVWRELFNGKDLIGWKHVGPGSHYVEEGLIKSKGGMGLLYWAGQKFGNCTFRIVYRMKDKNDNSGVFIRIPIEPYEEWMPVYYGYEVQIDNDPAASKEDDYHYTGTLYSISKPLAKTGKPGPEWNTMEITLDGDRTIVVLNGTKVTDYTEGDPVPPRKFDFEPFRGPRPQTGYMGLQNHSDKDLVFFKEVAVKPLKKK
jgi:hypothetical protein